MTAATAKTGIMNRRSGLEPECKAFGVVVDIGVGVLDAAGRELVALGVVGVAVRSGSADEVDVAQAELESAGAGRCHAEVRPT